MVLLRLRVEKLRVESIAQKLVLNRVVAGEEVEVCIAAIAQVERVWGQVVALGPKVGGVVLREGLGGLEKGLVGERGLLGILLGLRGGKVVRIVEASSRAWKGRGVVDGEVWIVTKARHVMLWEWRMRRRRSYIVSRLGGRGRAPALLDIHDVVCVAILVGLPVVEREARANVEWPRAGGARSQHAQSRRTIPPRCVVRHATVMQIALGSTAAARSEGGCACFSFMNVGRSRAWA